MNSMSGGSPKFRDKLPEGYGVGQIQQFTPEAMQLYKQLFSHVGPESYLSKLAGGDQEAFGEIERPALRQFNELQGGIASRFSGMGMGSRRSSGFQNQMTAASSNFAQQLQSQRQQLQRQAIQDLMGNSQMLLNQRPYERFAYQEAEEKGGMGGAMSGAMSGAGVGASFGPYGAIAGGLIGGAMGYFNK